MSGEKCNYPTESCICSNGEPPTSMLHWNCSTLTAGCPQDPPAVGSACTDNGLVCDYGACVGGERVICTAGKWVSDPGVCPG